MHFLVDNGSIYYELSETIEHTNKPILFVLPGGPGSDHSVYKFHSKELENFCCVVYYDPRGCGQSKNFEPLTATMENYINDLELLRSYLGINRFSILGTSYGSICAMGYAIKYSENLEKLILIGGSTSYRFLETAKENLAIHGTAEQKKMSEYLWDGNFKDDNHVTEFMRIMKSMYSKNATYVNSISSRNYSFSVDILNLGFSTFMRTFDFEADLDKILCPTLILVGKDDWINDPVHLQKARDNICSVQLRIIENCGHFVAIDQNDIYIKSIREFLFR